MVFLDALSSLLGRVEHSAAAPLRSSVGLPVSRCAEKTGFFSSGSPKAWASNARESVDSVGSAGESTLAKRVPRFFNDCGGVNKTRGTRAAGLPQTVFGGSGESGRGGNAGALAKQIDNSPSRATGPQSPLLVLALMLWSLLVVVSIGLFLSF